MAVRPFSLAIALVLFPLIASGQGYEWSQRAEATPPNGASYTQVDASQFGVYATGNINCDIEPRCPASLSKFRVEDGKLLWRRVIGLTRFNRVDSMTVDTRGVFVTGDFYDRPTRSWYSYVRRYTHDGDIVWTVIEQDLDFGPIDSDADGLYLGVTESSGQPMLQHMSFAGDLLWSRVLPFDQDIPIEVVVGDGLVFVAGLLSDVMLVYRTNGVFVREIPHATVLNPKKGQITFQSGFLYTTYFDQVTKYSPDGDVVWTYPFNAQDYEFGRLHGALSAIAADGDGVFVTIAMLPEGGATNITAGMAVLRLDNNGSLIDMQLLWNHRVRPTYLSAFDGELFVAGNAWKGTAAFVGRLSNEDLVAPSVLTLEGATAQQPPRLAVLHHDYGAGPVRVGLRDAAPGSIEYAVDFDDDLTPVGYDKVADMNGNGYEELVVVSRLPAVAEVRDSLDGSLLSRIKLGEHLDPIAADVEERAGQAPRLAVVARNESNDRLLVRIHNLASGALLDTLVYNPDFEPVDVLALPVFGGTTAHRYAVLSRNPLAGSPHKIEIRRTNSGLVENYWTSSDNEPLELALAGTAANPVLAALLDRPDALRPRVWQVDLQTGAGSSLNFTDERIPAAMAVLPDSDGNGSPQLSVLSETTGDQVKAESRDAQTGTLDNRFALKPDYRPRDIAYAGAVPGFGGSAIAVVGLLRAWNSSQDVVAPLRAEVVDVDGSELFDLEFWFGQ
jgi:hypothetical protein